jgi:hypothetical protein
LQRFHCGRIYLRQAEYLNDLMSPALVRRARSTSLPTARTQTVVVCWFSVKWRVGARPVSEYSGNSAGEVCDAERWRPEGICQNSFFGGLTGLLGWEVNQ